MRGRSRLRTRGRTGSNSLLSQATASLGVAPLHYWDFTTNRALFNGVDVGAVTSTPNWSFTRASTGYAQTQAGLLQSFASGVLRRTDRGALIEGAATNLCLQSQTFDNASWAKSGTTVTADAAVSPDGTTTADKLVESVGGTFHTLSQSVSSAGVSVPVTFSVYAKAAERTWLYVQMDAGVAMAADRFSYFDLGTGALGTKDASTTAVITALGSGWYRCTITATSTAAGGAVTCKFIMATNGSTISYSGDGASGVYIWGAQTENNSAYATSYIPTTTASATRAADVATVTSPGVAYPLSLQAEFELPVVGVARWLLVTQATSASTDSAILSVSATNDYAVTSYAATVWNGQSNGGAATANTTLKMAGRISSSGQRSAFNGTLNADDASVTVPATPTSITFVQAANPLNGYLRRAAIFNTALTDAQLQRATT